LRYFNIQGQTQYVLLQCNLKVDKKLSPIPNLPVRIYLDDQTDEQNLIGRTTTDQQGKSLCYLPISLKDKWIQSPQHTFIAVTDSIPEVGVRETESEITIARMTLDTVENADTRSVLVKFEELKENNWFPVADVEIKVGIKRLGSILPLGEEETATTDSTGTATVEFVKDSLPGDKHGNLLLMAKVEDHEVYGNLEAETWAPWGKPGNFENNFGKRSLWATGDKVPMWLLSLAFLIIFSVWGTLIYLIFRLFKIIKLGLH
jgi:hypothetical protein